MSRNYNTRMSNILQYSCILHYLRLKALRPPKVNQLRLHNEKQQQRHVQVGGATAARQMRHRGNDETLIDKQESQVVHLDHSVLFSLYC